MSTCAQNQANQDEDGNGNDNDHGPPGATSGPGAGHEAVQHFLANSQAGANGPGGVASSRSNGLGPQAARGIQVRQVRSHGILLPKLFWPTSYCRKNLFY